MPFYSTIAAAEADGLIHYWLMNEQSGDGAADIISGWNGKIVSVNGSAATQSEIDATAVPSPAGYGRNLGSRYISDSQEILPIELTSPAPSLSPLSAITVRLRLFVSSQPETWSPCILGQSTSPIELYQSASNNALYYKVGTRSGSVAGNFWKTGFWQDFIITGNSGGQKFYLDGVEVFSGLGSSNYRPYTNFSGSAINGYIGANTSFGLDYFADIIVQDFAIWNRALSPAEVSSLQTAGMSEPLTPPPPVDLKFDINAPISGGFVSYTPSYAGFVVNAPITPEFEVFQDWTKTLNSFLLQEAYQLIITGAKDSLDDLIVPIENWQATNQAEGRSAYLQAVIPAGDQYIESISARSNGELVIRKGFRLPGGSSQFSDILRSGFDSLRYDRSGNRFTVTVSGRRQNDVASSGSRTLTGIRTISVTDGKRRVRCNVDLFLRPGMTVTADNQTFRADFINYFVSTNDKFCEVSER